MTTCLDETTGARLVAGELSADEADVAHRHVATCRDCEQFVAELARAGGESQVTRLTEPETRDSAAELRRGMMVGRFLMLGRIGSGGMGVVHAAYDPELDRRVALKLLRGAGAAPDDIRARLLREAQAAARLSHPNVVSVFDIGVFEDRVYLAMEYVDGVTLTEWLRGDRTWGQVIDMFIQAGRGIAAAHEAGVIHRDFKPDNVLVGRDGRARVVDFGLARAANADPTPAPAAVDSSDPDETQPASAGLGIAGRLTRTGTMLGTPRYMAPEQFSGGEITPNTDQFGFCVALYQALYRTPPFAAERVSDIATRVLAGEIAPPVENRGPIALRRALVRGLAVEPGRRHASMTALLHELERSRSVRKRALRAGLISTLIVLAALAVFGLSRDRTVTETRCEGMDEKLAGVWDPARADAVRTAFLATKRAHAADTYDGVAARFGDYTRTWVAARVDACKATHVRGDQSDTLLDLRMACLDRRLAELDALVGVFAKQPSTQVLDRAVEAAANLSPTDGCVDRDALETVVHAPPDPTTRANVDSLERQLADVNALDQTGQYLGALAITRTITSEAERIGYAPVHARALYRRALLETKTGDAKSAETTLGAALLAAADARDDVLAARIWAELVGVVGNRLTRPDEALRLRPGAEAALRRAGGEPEAAAHLSRSLGLVFYAQGKFDQARSQMERALALREKALGPDHPDVAGAVNDIGNTFYAQGKYDEARSRYESVLALGQRHLGPDHPSIARSLTNLGAVLRAQGKYDDARGHFERALAIYEQALGPDHPDVATTLSNLGSVLDAQHQYAQARRHYESALEIRERTLGPDDPGVASTLNNLGDVLRVEGKPNEAAANYERALAIFTKVLGPDHPKVAVPLNNLGVVYQQLGKYDEARKHFERALAIDQKALGPDHPDLGYDLTGLATALLSLDRPQDAFTAAARATQIREAGAVPVEDLATSRFVLARALWGLGRERGRAIELARQARDGYRSLGEPGRAGLAEIEAWLIRRRAPPGSDMLRLELPNEPDAPDRTRPGSGPVLQLPARSPAR